MTKNYDVCLSNILHVPKRCNSCQHGIYRVKLVGDFATYYAFNLELLIEGKHTTKLYGHALILPDLSYWSDCSEWPDWLNWIIIIICGCHLQSWSDKNEVHWQLLPCSSQIRSQIRFWISCESSEDSPKVAARFPFPRFSWWEFPILWWELPIPRSPVSSIPSFLFCRQPVTPGRIFEDSDFVWNPEESLR